MRRFIGVLMFAASGTVTLGALPALAEQVSGKEEMKLTNRVRENLQNDSDLKNNQIDVRVDNGVVTLKGVVDTDGEKIRSEQLARVKGVSRVDNKLEVKSASAGQAVKDSAVTAALRAKFLAKEQLRQGDISVSTNNGVVTLSGTVPSQDARATAVDVARNMDGVARVEDRLQVGSTAAPVSSPPVEAPAR